MVKKNSVPVVSKIVSPAVAKAVQAAVIAPVVAEVKERATKVSSSVYLEAYIAEVQIGGTWASLMESHPDWSIGNVRAAVGAERKACYDAKLAVAMASPVNLLALKKIGKTPELWAQEKTDATIPLFTEGSTRNTEKAKRVAGYAAEEFSL